MKLKIESNRRTFIGGKTRSGKTYCSKYLIREYPHRLIYDIKREYSEFGLVVHDEQNLKRAALNGCTKIVYQPNDLSIEHFDNICKFVYAELRNVLFVVEEVHKFCTKHKIPDSFNSIVTIAEGDLKIGLLCISQRPANVHNDVLSQSSVIISFKQSFPDDAEAMSKMMPGTTAEDIIALPYKHFLVYNDREETKALQRFLPL